MNRIRQRLYTYEDYRIKNGHWSIVTLPDKYLFADGRYPTKLRESDLPEWFVYGRFYKRFGYLSAKGITDMLYLPNLWVNHFLKDDCLLISYGGKIIPNPDYETNPCNERYIGWDERVWGNAILDMLKGAEHFSGYDIQGFGAQLKEKLAALKKNHPDEFGDYEFDVDRWLCEPYKKIRPEQITNDGHDE